MDWQVAGRAFSSGLGIGIFILIVWDQVARILS